MFPSSLRRLLPQTLPHTLTHYVVLASLEICVDQAGLELTEIYPALTAFLVSVCLHTLPTPAED